MYRSSCYTRLFCIPSLTWCLRCSPIRSIILDKDRRECPNQCRYRSILGSTVTYATDLMPWPFVERWPSALDGDNLARGRTTGVLTHRTETATQSSLLLIIALSGLGL
ncbi:hypothetical protein F5148DRAFT_825501 [Russula earlei]|uniref:Uncharacterized protein n=1 Tax=Russula earlei TaxID=71964 RepID=A0ACC0TSI7_9AGAM|nr:hypothetical protein F5148DRAFT_825501 [Russula earlei]